MMPSLQTSVVGKRQKRTARLELVSGGRKQAAERSPDVDHLGEKQKMFITSSIAKLNFLISIC